MNVQTRCMDVLMYRLEAGMCECTDQMHGCVNVQTRGRDV